MVFFGRMVVPTSSFAIVTPEQARYGSQQSILGWRKNHKN
jgi:hypothetical protein